MSPGNETHLHAFATEMIGPDGARARRYLHTSPEFAMKKLLAAGEEKIVDFARVFRNRERGALHAPEFTLVEWYRAGEPYEAMMADCAAVVRQAAKAAGATHLAWRGQAPIRLPNPRRSPSPMPFAAMRRSILRRSAAIATASPRRRANAGCGWPTTTRGRTSSAAC